MSQVRDHDSRHLVVTARYESLSHHAVSDGVHIANFQFPIAN